MADETRALDVVDRRTGEVDDQAPPEVGGLVIFSPGAAKKLRALVLQYQEDALGDEHFVWYASWLERGRRRRKGCDSRQEAEAHLRRQGGGRVEAVKRAVAYDILKMPLNVSSEPAPEHDEDLGCRQHEGAHVVYRRGWRVTLPNGRYEVDRGTVATCEKISDDEKRVLWGDRVEHDPERTAERRAYVRAMRKLLGFGEPTPYDVTVGEGQSARPALASAAAPRQAAATSAPTPVSEVAPSENEGRAWSALWAKAHELGFDKQAVHRLFKLEARDGALQEYAHYLADTESRSLAEVIDGLREHLVAGAPSPAPPAPHN